MNFDNDCLSIETKTPKITSIFGFHRNFFNFFQVSFDLIEIKKQFTLLTT